MMDSYRLWLQFLGAVDWLARVARPGLTPVEAMEEAMRWWLTGAGDPEFGPAPPPVSASERDPLGATLGVWLEGRGTDRDPMPAAAVLEEALRNWCQVMANEHNDGESWPHPTPAGGWPSVSASGS